MNTRVALELMLAAGRVPGRAGRLTAGVLAGVLLGRLDEDSLRRLDELYYSRSDLYRTDAWNRRGLLPWERAVVGRVASPPARVGVLGCGGGREVLGLLRAGYDAIGFESHPLLAGYGADFLARCGYPGRVIEAPRDAFPSGVTFDVVILGWGVMSLIAPRSRRLEVLAAAARAVPEAGGLIASAFIRNVLGRDLALVHRLGGAAAPVELGDTLAPNRVHVFTPQGLAEEVSAAGWRSDGVQFISGMGTPTGYGCITGWRR